MRSTTIRKAAFVGLLAASMLPGAAPALAADPVEIEFSFTGAEQTFDVPAGVTTIHVVLIGGAGTDYVDLVTYPGGRGARVEGDLTVAPADRLYVEVGGSGFDGGGFNGGGGGIAVGGGASDLRTISRGDPDSLDSRVIVAAGGGGASGCPGGDAGQAGACFGGQPGTATAGGGGGAGDFPGQGGSLGSGGEGAADGDGTPFGGGGGGGYYGGGGGGVAIIDGGVAGGGGGGGSSFIGAATGTSVTLDDSGVSSITLTYTPLPPTSGVVDADVSVPASAACIELSATSVTFGTQRFGGEDLPSTPSISVSNCSGSDETLLARGTDAAGPGAVWHLTDAAGSCAAGTLATDDYHLKLRRADTDEVTRLSTDNKAIRALVAGAGGTLDALIDMPCPGSSGAGETMGMQIVFVVTE